MFFQIHVCNLYFQIHVCRVALILHDSKVLYSCLSSFKGFKEKNNVYYLNLLQIFWVLLAKFSLPACSISSVCFIKIKLDWKADFLLCRLRSIATHKDHFVRRPSVRLSHSHVAMFRRRHVHSSECCHYFFTSVFIRVTNKDHLCRCLSINPVVTLLWWSYFRSK